ncbi:hypothetical protein ACHAQA_001899 [Verticillium albo-atrum]
MDDDAPSVVARADHDLIKPERYDSEDTRMADSKPTYKSWKKKYRKMRITFDQKMHDGEELHKQEQKALAMAKRIAIENDRLLDLLLELNESQQIPLEKRLDIALTPPADEDPLDKDLPKPTKSLDQVLRDVPHTSYAQAKERFPAVVADMEPFAGEANPPSFLNPDDIDEYLWDLDRRIDDSDMLPTLAPSARPNSVTTNNSTSQSIALRNPTSVYNWLRKNAPKTFLQDAEQAAPADKDDTHHDEAAPVEVKRKRKSGVGAGAVKSERGGGRGSRGGKRRSGAVDRLSISQSHKEKEAEEPQSAAREANTEKDGDFFNLSSSTRGTAKRKRDEDVSYRPKGGSSGRPSKKKRKSGGEGELETPTGKSTSRRGGKGRTPTGSRGRSLADEGHDE